MADRKAIFTAASTAALAVDRLERLQRADEARDGAVLEEGA